MATEPFSSENGGGLGKGTPKVAKSTCSRCAEMVPLNAGYFVCSSAGVRFLLRLLQSRHGLRKCWTVIECHAHHAIKFRGVEQRPPLGGYFAGRLELLLSATRTGRADCR